MSGPARGDLDLARRAQALVEIGRFREASDLLRDTLASGPSDPQTWCSLASALMQADQAALCLQAARSALALDPECAAAHRLSSSALRCLGRSSEAVAAARECVRLEPAYHNFWILSGAELVAGHKAEALDAARQALELAPDHAFSHVIMATVAARRHRPWQTERHARRALEIDPENTQAMELLAGALSMRGRLWQALRYQDAAARLDPSSPGARIGVGVALGALFGAAIVAALMGFGALVSFVADVRNEAVPSGVSQAMAGAIIALLGAAAVAVTLWRLPPSARALLRGGPRLLLVPPCPVPPGWVGRRVVGLVVALIFALGGVDSALSPAARDGAPVAGVLVQVVVCFGLAWVLGRSAFRGWRVERAAGPRR